VRGRLELFAAYIPEEEKVRYRTYLAQIPITCLGRMHLKTEIGLDVTM